MHWQFLTNLLGGNTKGFDLTQPMEYDRTGNKVICISLLLFATAPSFVKTDEV